MHFVEASCEARDGISKEMATRLEKHSSVIKRRFLLVLWIKALMSETSIVVLLQMLQSPMDLSVDPGCAVLSWLFWSFWSLSLYLRSWPSLVHPREHWSPSSTALQKTGNMWRFLRCRMVCISEVSLCHRCVVHDKMYEGITSRCMMTLISCWSGCLSCSVLSVHLSGTPYPIHSGDKVLVCPAARCPQAWRTNPKGQQSTWNTLKRKGEALLAVNALAMSRWNTEIYGVSLR